MPGALLIPPGAVQLGQSVPLASAAASTPVISWTGAYRKIFIYHFIAGYSGGGAIALLRFGNATTVDTGTNYSSMTTHAVAGGTTWGTHTARASQAGMHVANDSTTNGRRGQHEIWNDAANPKMCDSRTVTFTTTNPTTAAAVHATYSLCSGNWWNTSGTIQCVDLSGNGVNLLTGSFIDVYGTP